ncbi:MAG: flagellar basal body protein FliL, partial [Magnetovibrio sp.]|nr:flagellar basal body protein FliL [Magnetovibrio sp.]
MADEEVDDETEDFDGEEGEEEGGGGRKRLIIVIGGVLVLILGGLAAAYFTGMLQPVMDMLGGGEPAPVEGAVNADGAPVEGANGSSAASGDAVFYDLQEMLVNINTGGRKPVYLKIRVSLELASSDDIVQIEAVMPRIIDNFQIYLREL